MSEKNKRIIVIAPLPPPFGGLAFITKSLFDAGLKDKFDVVHLNTSKGSLTEKFGKITVQDVLLSAWILFKLFRICFRDKNIQYALILGTNGSAIIRIAAYIFILKLFNIKAITNLHGTRLYNKRKGLIKKLNNYVVNQSELILSPTKIDLEGLLPNFNKKHHLKLFYNSTNVLTDLSSANKNPLISSDFIVIGIGRLSRAKGTYDLLNVCIELLKSGYKLKLIWIGRGAFPSDDKYAVELISDLDLNIQKQIEIYRDIDDAKKYELINLSDVFVLPSYSDNLPISILEAMAFGKPVISTKIGAIPEVIKDNINGWLIDPGDIEKLKSLILLLLGRKVDLISICNRNRSDYQEMFSTQQRIKELVEYLK
jgi:glycosyltransferase involved in cell wall biosynthesis